VIVVLGAGLAGLSAAFHLKNKNYRIFEREGEVGGLCRSVVQDGFTFDYTGHLLHSRHPYTQELLADLLPGELNTHERRAAIYHDSGYIPYPFQANLWALERSKIRECLLEFIESYCARTGTPENFLSWIYQAFGKGIAKYFMVPYNNKLWQVPLEEISLEWVERFVPCPNLEEVVDGALGGDLKAFGYNQTFLYPMRGGIGVLPQAFLSKIHDVHLNKEAQSIDIEKKTVRFKDGQQVSYDTLISSLPLDELLRSIICLPAEISAMKDHLRYVSVLNINLGVNRAHVSDYHWIYYPDPKYPFYRVGFPSNLSPHMVPEGTGAISVEISYLPSRPPAVEEIREDTLSGLRTCGILRDDDRILTEKILRMKHAYVVYDSFRQKHLSRLLTFLRGHEIYPVGRYALWSYATMEDAILQGKDVAESLS